jgi:methanogenic corrinoid protein MtbC1
METIAQETLSLSEEFERALLSLDRLAARRLLIEAGEHSQSVQQIEQVVVPALERIGDGWEKGNIALSQVYMSGRICEDLVDEILPPSDPKRKNQPKMAIAVLEDHHVLGKRIVYSALRAAGYDLADYGPGISTADLVTQTLHDQIEILLISTLMLRSALQVKMITTQLAAAGANTKVIVGGAPFLFDAQLWQAVGADAMGRNASDAITVVHKVMGGAA